MEEPIVFIHLNGIQLTFNNTALLTNKVEDLLIKQGYKRKD